MKKQLITFALIGMIAANPILCNPFLNTYAAKQQFITFHNYSDTEENAKELVAGVDITNAEAIQTAGFQPKNISAEEDLSAGDLYMVTNDDLSISTYIYIDSQTTLHLTGVDTSERVAFIFEPSATYYEFQKLDDTYTVPTDLTCMYHDNVSTVSLPEGFSWESDTIVNALGEQTYQVKYTPKNPLKYKTVEHIDVTVTGTIKVVTSLEIPSLSSVVYSETQTLNDIPLPEGWTWDEPETVPTYETTSYPATYHPTPEECYDITGLSSNQANIPLTVTPPGVISEYNVEIGTGWCLYDIPKPTSAYGSYTYQTENAQYTTPGTYNATLRFVPNVSGVQAFDVPMTITVIDTLIAYTEPSNLTATYGDTVSQITLPQGWVWNEPKKKVGDAGMQSIPASFNDGKNVIKKNLSVTVKKAQAPTIAKPKGITTEWYEGIKLADISLPSGWSWDSASLKMGENKYKVTYKVGDSDLKNYNYKTEDFHAEITLKVTPATPIYNVPSTICVKSGTTLSDSLLPTVENGKFVWQDTATVTADSTYKCKFIPKDTEHYKTISDIEVKVSITPEVESKEEKPVTNPVIQPTKPKKEVSTHTVKKDTKAIPKIKDQTVKPKLKNIFARDIVIANAGVTDKTVTIDNIENTTQAAATTENVSNSSGTPNESLSAQDTTENTQAESGTSSDQKQQNKTKVNLPSLIVGFVCIVGGCVAASIFIKRKRSQRIK